MRITALTENTSVTEGIRAEHGLSLYIETATNRILFDMGQSTLFAENAAALGIDISAVDIAVLSHGHYDHGGGLTHFLKLNTKAPVYVSPYAFGEYYNGTDRYIGLDKSLKKSNRLVYTDEVFSIRRGLTLYSHNQSPKRFAPCGFGLTEKKDDGAMGDAFLHEQYLLIEEQGKRVLISGCSHKGVLNIVDWFSPDVLIGGFHLSSLPTQESLKSYAEYLDDFDAEYYTCHCTGTEQFGYMSKYMKRISYLSAGQTITV